MLYFPDQIIEKDHQSVNKVLNVKAQHLAGHMF